MWITINTGGTLNFDERKGGAEGVARSHLAFLGAWSKPLPGITYPFMAELMALWEEVIFTQPRGFSHVTMEVDCLELVNLWQSRCDSRSVAAPILEE